MAAARAQPNDGTDTAPMPRGRGTGEVRQRLARTFQGMPMRHRNVDVGNFFLAEIYGVVAYTAARQQRDIGIRLALAR